MSQQAERRHVARVGLGLLVPGVALLVAGRPELIVYAVFGSFAGMYGRREAPADRLRHQRLDEVVGRLDRVVAQLGREAGNAQP